MSNPITNLAKAALLAIGSTFSTACTIDNRPQGPDPIEPSYVNPNPEEGPLHIPPTAPDDPSIDPYDLETQDIA